GGGSDCSVTLVALLRPGIPVVVVAVALPEPRFVMVEELESGHPLGALPEVEMGNQQAGRATVLLWEGLPFVLPDHPGLASGHVGEREVGGVPGVGGGQHVGRR